MPGAVELSITEGPMRGQHMRFEDHDAVIFGRAPDCHVRLMEQDRRISRHHFILELNPPEACLRDLGSRNGTMVNGQRYGKPKGLAEGEEPTDAHMSVQLKDGDEVQAGATTFQVTIEAPKAARAKPAAADLVGQAVQAAGAASADQETPPDLPGYTLSRKLGVGGYGVVWYGTRDDDGQEVAVKLMLPKRAADERSRLRFLREIKVNRALKHQNVARVLDNGQHGEAFYLVQEYCAGGSIDRLLRARGPLPLEIAAPITLACLEGLEYAHRKGVVHRDIKPANLLLAREASGQGLPKLTDFGLAKSFVDAGLSGMTMTGAYAGTALFMPREQLINFKFVKPVSDLWSIAATFYFMLTGRAPREFPKGQPWVEVVLKGGHVPAKKRTPNLPDSVCRFLERALADDEKTRHQTAAHMLRSLEEAMNKV